MTKKHYEAIAAVLREQYDAWQLTDEEGFSSEAYAVADVAIELAAFMAEDNPRFDRARFLAACGMA